MDLLLLKNFFQTMVLLNIGLMLYWLIIIQLLSTKLQLKIVNKFFKVSEEEYDNIMMLSFALFKLLFAVFVLVPYIALVIVS